MGGFDYGKNKFNHVMQAWRQPGSSFKPFIYSSAIEKGFNGATVVNDAPLFFDAGTTGSQPWEPKNYDGKFEGPMKLRDALAKSKNMVSIRILQSVGPAYAQQWISRFGFDPGAASALPDDGARLGLGHPDPDVHRLRRVRHRRLPRQSGADHQGGRRPRQGAARGAVPKPFDDSMRAIEPRNAFMIESLLNTVTLRGTAAAAQRILKRPDVYGKTGTTNDSLDAWFCGFQPSLAAVVWIGYDNPRKLGDRETGGGLALPVWIEYMQTALKDVPQQPLEAPGRRHATSTASGTTTSSGRRPASPAWGWTTSRRSRRPTTRRRASWISSRPPTERPVSAAFRRACRPVRARTGARRRASARTGSVRRAR